MRSYARLPPRHDREEKADHIDAFFKQGSSHILCKPSVAQHNRHNRVIAIGHIKARRLHLSAEIDAILMQALAQLSACFNKIKRLDRGADEARRQRVREEVRPRLLAQKINDGLGRADIACLLYTSDAADD